jgi:XTP/dITP diphosphohydrolase
MPHNSTRAAVRRLVVASGNAGKLRELRSMFAGLPFALVAQDELGVTGVPETGATFLANAMLKARHAAAATGLCALADDSGLEVDALGGAPGIHSARYAGSPADDAANNVKLLAALRGIPASARTARYRCVLVLLPAAPKAGCGAPDAPIIAEGVWEGVIVDEPRGTGGFGYDAYFWLPELGVTAAQLSAAQKNQLSHRGTALRSLLDTLKSQHALESQDALKSQHTLESQDALNSPHASENRQ